MGTAVVIGHSIVLMVKLNPSMKKENSTLIMFILGYLDSMITKSSGKSVKIF